MTRQNWLAVALCVATATAAAAAIEIPPPERKWVRVQSRHFNVVSTASERAARATAVKLELVTAALGRVNTKFEAKPDDTRVFLFGTRRDSQPYIDFLLGKQGSPTPGMFVGNFHGTGTILVDNSRVLAERTIFHELTHNLVASGGSRMPLWLEEGLAEFFSSAEISGNYVMVGQPVLHHQRWLRARKLIPFQAVFALDRGSKAAEHPLFYAQAWGAVDWMMRAGMPKFDRFVTELESGLSADEALQRVYGINGTVLERLLKRRPQRPAATLRIGVHADLTTSAAAIPRGEALHDLGEFLGRLNSGRVEAERHFQAAIEDDPSCGRAHAGIGTLRAREKSYDQAVPHFEKALQISPADPEVRLMYAEALLRNAIGSFGGTAETGADHAARFRKARELAISAIELGCDRGRAQAIVGVSYGVESDVGPGVDALVEALEAHPLRIDVALTLYGYYLRGGDQTKADGVYGRHLARSRHPQTPLAARQILERERKSQSGQ